MKVSAAVHRHTPTLAAFDSRGLVVREIGYHRSPDELDIASRITRHQRDVLGRLARSADPRLHDRGLWNVVYQAALAGQVVCTRSVDAGLSLCLHDAAHRPARLFSHIRVLADDSEDYSEAVLRTWSYEDSTLRGRPLVVTDQASGEDVQISERFVYAGVTDDEQARNLAGQCVEHHDPAGVLVTNEVALTGAPLSVTRCLQDEDEPSRCALFTTLTRTDATGAPLATTDAAGNRQRFAYDLAGQPASHWLTLSEGSEVRVAAFLAYDAAGSLLSESHGNGVKVSYRHEAQTRRLTGIRVERPAGHSLGAALLQDLHYEYDPVGNVSRAVNEAESPRFWRNQRILPENTYLHDSLYQLVRSTGREMATARPQDGRQPCPALALDDATYTRYVRTYCYDSGANLTRIRHSAPAAASSYTTDITVSDRSCRALIDTLAASPDEVDRCFTAAGGQRWLQPGQSLGWSPRGELRSVSLMARDGAQGDGEHYRYDAAGQRAVKRSWQATQGGTRRQQVVYLPALELRTGTRGEVEESNLQVILLPGPALTQARMLHWQSGKPDGLDNDQLRYSYTTLIGNCGLELDGRGGVISREEYYAFGGTAIWLARNAVEADYKTTRFSGKERDVTGLYYFGHRYYQSWAGRWLSADPAGTVDGLNQYRMVGNNPASLFDATGLMMQAPQARPARPSTPPVDVLATGLTQFSSSERHQVLEALQAASEIMSKVTGPEPLAADEMQVWFGPAHESGTQAVVQAWESISRFVTTYASPYPGYQKFHRISSSDSYELARIHRKDFDGVLNLDDGFFDAQTSVQARTNTIIHELSHLRRV